MPIPLSPAMQQEIYDRIYHAFSDFKFFNSLVSKQLRECISDVTTHVEIDMKTTKKIVERYYDTSLFLQTNLSTPSTSTSSSSTTAKNNTSEVDPKKQRKILLSQVDLILKTTYVLILSYLAEYQNNHGFLFQSTNELLQQYPEFVRIPPTNTVTTGTTGVTETVNVLTTNLDADELTYLLHFRNYLKLALIIIPPKMNKNLLIKIASRLEGSGNFYITGGGQKPAVTRREYIFEKETAIPKMPKKKKNIKVDQMSNSENPDNGLGVNQSSHFSGDYTDASSDSDDSANRGNMNSKNKTVSSAASTTNNKRKKSQAKTTSEGTNKRGRTYILPKDLQAIRLTSEEIHQLVKAPTDPFIGEEDSVYHHFQGSSRGQQPSQSTITHTLPVAPPLAPHQDDGGFAKPFGRGIQSSSYTTTSTMTRNMRKMLSSNTDQSNLNKPLTTTDVLDRLLSNSAISQDLWKELSGNNDFIESLNANASELANVSDLSDLSNLLGPSILDSLPIAKMDSNNHHHHHQNQAPHVHSYAMLSIPLITPDLMIFDTSGAMSPPAKSDHLHF